MRSYQLHTFDHSIPEEIVDVPALFRNVASAVPDIAFRARFEHPMPNAFLEELERLEEINSIARGRPVLVPE